MKVLEDENYRQLTVVNILDEVWIVVAPGGQEEFEALINLV